MNISVLSFIMLLISMSCIVPAAAAVETDFSRHPIYSKYDFGTPEKIIVFGVQPLAFPEGVVAEVMKRDRILQRELRARGKEIRYLPFYKGIDCNYFMNKGKVAFTLAGESPALAMAAASKAVIVALAKQGTTSVVTLRKYSSLADLRGRTIGYPEGSTAHLALLIALESAGVRQDEVRLVPMDVTDLITAINTRQIDAFTAWEPTPSMALAQSNELAIVSRFVNSGYLYFSRAFIGKQPQETRIILAAYMRAIRWMQASKRNLNAATVWAIKTASDFQGRAMQVSTDRLKGITEESLLRFDVPAIPITDLQDGGYINRVFLFYQKSGMIVADAQWLTIKNSFNYSLLNSIIARPGLYKISSFDYRTD